MQDDGQDLLHAAPDAPSQPEGELSLVAGFPEAQRRRVATLFWEAFSGKLGRIMRPEDRALSYIDLALSPSFAFSVLDSAGTVLGVAGFKTDRGGLVSSGFGEVVAAYGWIGACWRAPLLELTERSLQDGQLLLDGIFVSKEARGRGIGSRLLQHVLDEASRLGYREVRLDVVDSNPRARALYERTGFIAAEEERLGLARHLFGFETSTTMIYRIRPEPE